MRKSLLLAWTAVAVGCQGDPEHGASRGDGLEKQLVSVPGQQVTEGFAHGQIRRERLVEGFRITRTPITVGQYESCVEGSGCKAPKQSCSNFKKGADDEALLCASAAQADQFCRWHGGRLPTLSEWFLAARGPAVRRFSWGDDAPTCEQHSLAGAYQSPLTTEAADRCESDPGKQRRIGRHSDGASPAGVEDVMLTGAELLGGDPEARFAPCRGKSAACSVYGIAPGAIDSVQGVPGAGDSEDAAEGSGLEPSDVSSFRCVFEEEN